MKKAIITGISLLIVISSFAQQSPSFGVKGGIQFSNMNFDHSSGNRAGFHLGGFVNLPVNEAISIQGELLYSSQGHRFDDTPDYINDRNIVSYLNIPVLLRYTFAGSLYAEAGLQPGLLLSAHEKWEETETGEKDSDNFAEYLKKFDVGIGGGAGYRITPRLDISLRYMYGLVNSLFKDGTPSNNTVLSVGLAYRF